ncbi:MULTISPECIES: LPS assembly lipoprotein LptE [Flammeovirga]|uniref:LptE family protein n=1 Tax=Flammeovirga agarivorans TaxID=2726742 RepID=A0A7X8SI24_9BACT|nr:MULTISPECIES: LPS assembly lipoprotein LptE [Flammeovirga]NLR90522.1 LptE family protein [Flammeovirga agarivorans]
MNNIKFSYKYLIICFLAISACTGVKFTFSGVNIDPRIKTFSIEPYTNEASDGPATMAFQFTDDLTQYILRNTSLLPAPQGQKGDIEFSGAITGYRVTPVSPGGGESQQTQQQRLTITVKTNFINNYDDEKSFDQGFSFFYDFPGNQTVQQVETEAIDVIFEQIIYDTFQKALADW